MHMMTGADRKLLALGVKSADFTAKELAKILDYLQKAIKNGLSPTEQKSYGDFQQPGGVSLLNVTPEQKDVQDFTELARQQGVNVSVKHDPQANTYYLCLQGQLKDIQQAVTEHQKRQREHTQSRSAVTERLEQAKTQTASHSADNARTQGREHNAREG